MGEKRKEMVIVCEAGSEIKIKIKIRITAIIKTNIPFRGIE